MIFKNGLQITLDQPIKYSRRRFELQQLLGRQKVIFDSRVTICKF